MVSYYVKQKETIGKQKETFRETIVYNGKYSENIRKTIGKHSENNWKTFGKQM